jgi:hypothetical protein
LTSLKDVKKESGENDRMSINKYLIAFMVLIAATELLYVAYLAIRAFFF